MWFDTTSGNYKFTIMFTPIDMNDELLNRLTAHDIDVVRIHDAGNYEKECVVLQANKDIDLSDYMLMCMIEGADGLPDYDKCRLLTFDCIDVKRGNRVCIYSCHGEDTDGVSPKTGKHYDILFWNLDHTVWDIPHGSVEIMERGNSYSVVFDR